MAEPCGSSIGHSDCNFPFIEKDHEGHKASPESWRNTKNKPLKKKWSKQRGA